MYHTVKISWRIGRYVHSGTRLSVDGSTSHPFELNVVTVEHGLLELLLEHWNHLLQHLEIHIIIF